MHCSVHNLSILLALLFVFASAGRTRANENDFVGDAPLIAQQTIDAAVGGIDFAALSLSPADLDNIDRPGYARDAASMKLLPDQMVDLANACGVTGKTVDSPVARVIEDRLHSAGWQWQYIVRDGLVNPADPSRFSRIVTTAVTQYAGTEGAKAGFAYLEDETGNCFGIGDDVPGLSTIGDMSELTRVAGPDPSVETLVLSILHHNVVVSVALTDATGHSPDIDVVEALGRELHQRIVGSSLDESTSLCTTALRLDAPAIPFTARLYGVVPGMRLAGGAEEGYLRRDGRDVPEVGESAGVYAARQRAFSNATDVYQVRQVLGTGTTAPVYRILLTRFDDGEAASNWFPGVQAFAEIQGLTGVATVPDAPQFGEESLVMAFQLTTGERTTAGYLISAREGADVVIIILLAEQAPRRESVEQLMKAQLECLSASECPVRYPVPSGVR